MKLIKKIGIGFCIGTTIGILISIIVNYSLGLEYYSPASSNIINRFGSVNSMLLMTLLSGLIGIISITTIVIYDSEKRSTLASSLIHFSLIIITVLIIGAILNWYDSIYSLIILLLINIFIYFCFWIPNYIINKMRSEKLNKQLFNRK